METWILDYTRNIVGHISEFWIWIVFDTWMYILIWIQRANNMRSFPDIKPLNNPLTSSTVIVHSASIFILPQLDYNIKRSVRKDTVYIF